MTAAAADYRAQFDKETLGAWDLPRDCTVTIERWKREKIGRDQPAKDGKKATKASNKIWLYFVGKTKPLVLNITNARTIAGMYGVDVNGWIGKRITMYATTTTFGRDTVDCIRIRPQIPGANAQNAPADPTPPPQGGTDA